MQLSHFYKPPGSLTQIIEFAFPHEWTVIIFLLFSIPKSTNFEKSACATKENRKFFIYNTGSQTLQTNSYEDSGKGYIGFKNGHQKFRMLFSHNSSFL